MSHSTPPAITEAQGEALQELQAALARAGQTGLIDVMAASLSHPDLAQAFASEAQAFAESSAVQAAPAQLGKDGKLVKMTELPEGVIALAKRYRLHNEAGEILCSEDQGESEFATLCVDRWLTARSGQTRLEVRIIQRETTNDDFWPCGKSIQSEPLTEAQALQLVNHWGRTSQAAVQLSQQNERAERERFDAFGPRPKQPWEVEPTQSQDGPGK
jgi:hypothetical protein